MTVPSDISKVTHNGDNTTGPWTIPFKFYADVNTNVPSILVTKTSATNSDTTLTNITDYATFGVGDDSGGYITTTVLLAVGEKITISRNEPFTQQLELPESGLMPSKSVEAELDRLLMLSQQLNEQQARTLKLPVSSTGVAPEFDPLVANAALVADPTGLKVTNGPDVSDIAAAAANAAAAAVAVVQAGLYATAADIASQAVAIRWALNGSVAVADPAAGNLSFNNASLASATILSISATSGNTGAGNVHDYVMSWDDSSSVSKGTLILRSLTDPAKFASFRITGTITDNTGWMSMTVGYFAGNGTFTAGDMIAVGFAPTGDGGTLSASTIVSSNANAFNVTPNTTANSAFLVNASAASGVNGFEIDNSASGTAPTLRSRGPGTNVDAIFCSQANGNAIFGSGAGNFTQVVAGNSTYGFTATNHARSNAFRQFTHNDLFSDVSTASFNMDAQEMVTYRWDFSANVGHQTGSYTTQRDAIFMPATHSAAAASVITNGIGYYIGGGQRAGANMTLTNSYGLFIDTINVANGGSVGTSFAAVFNAMTGATTNNGISVLGGKSLFAPATTGYASINLASGVAPSSPVNGDMWYDGTNFKGRQNGVTVNMAGGITSATVQASTAGSAITFTGIPATAKRVTVSFDGVSTNGTSNILIKSGNGSIISTGYSGASNADNTAGVGTLQTFSTGMLIYMIGAAAQVLSGKWQQILHDATNNIWVGDYQMGSPSGAGARSGGGGRIALSGALDRISIQTGNGTDTFDAGSINVHYE